MKTPAIKPHEKELAISLMREVLYDNGCVSATEPEGSARHYPLKHVRKIGAAAGKFFEASPEKLNDGVIQDLACGEYGEVREKYGRLPWFDELEAALEAWHDEL